ncbi:MAG: TlpA disulfide reductase family protein, partial [Myxococcota bacterium]
FVVGLLRDWGIAILVVLAVFGAYNVIFAPKPPALGDAVDFTLTDLDGRAVTLSAIDDDVVILNFWFTSCPPCRAEIPELSRYHAAHPEIPMYGVSIDRTTTPRLAQQSAKLGVTYPVLHDRDGAVANRYGITSFPTTLVIRGGRIVQARVGAVNGAVLDQLVRVR